MFSEKKVGGPTGLEQASRSASRWMSEGGPSCQGKRIKS